MALFPPHYNIGLSDAKARRAMSIYLVFTSTLLGIFNLSIELVQQVFKFTSSTTYGTILTLFFFTVMFIAMIIKMQLPWRFFGFRLGNLKKDIPEALLWTILFCVFLLLLKFWLITQFLLFKNKNLFVFTSESFFSIPPYLHGYYSWFFTGLLYVLFTPLQAFIMQGAIQSPLMFLLDTKNAGWISVMVATIMFGAFHIDLHLVYAYSVIIPGFLWAILYARQRSLVGVTLSHAIIGMWAFWGLGLQDIFYTISKAMGLPSPQ